MSSRSSGPADRQVKVALCLMAATLVVGLICVASAHAAYYKLVLCAAGNGSTGYETRTNTACPGNPNGIFRFENYCGPAGDSAGPSATGRVALLGADRDGGAHARAPPRGSRSPSL